MHRSLIRFSLVAGAALTFSAILPATTYAGPAPKSPSAATALQAVRMVVRPYITPGYNFANCTRLNPRLYPNLICPETAGDSFDAMRGQIRRNDTHEVVDVEHTTWAEMMDSYFQHAEAKMADPTGIGVLSVRHVRAPNQVFLGKETSEVLEELQDESGGVIPYGDAELYGQTDLTAILSGYSDAEVMKATGLAKQTLRDLRAGSIPRCGTLTRLMDGLCHLEMRPHACQ